MTCYVDEDGYLFLAERIARYKQPRTIEVTTERLCDDAGKVRRSALRETRLEAATAA